MSLAQSSNNINKNTSFDNEDKEEEEKQNSPKVITVSTSEQETKSETSKDDCIEQEPSTSQTEEITDENTQQNEETEELKIFIKACRKAESSNDMKKIIKKKLLKNYHLVSPNYVLSKNFRKMLRDTALQILRDPKRVYSKLRDIVSELEARKHTFIPPVVEVTSSTSANEGSQENENESENGIQMESTGDEKKDNHLRKLNKALIQLKRRIEDLDVAEVNLDDDDDSAYMQKVKYEKRAIEIYNKICELTGESSHAYRIVKKPIKFKDTNYKEFNKALTKKINKENGFPSYFDVYRLFDYCNNQHNYQLVKYQIEEVARNAFVKVGELLKERRREDLYESACHWTRESKDPAKEDAELKAKLDINREIYRKKTEEILDYYSKKQYEENKSDQQPGTSKDLSIKEQEEGEENEDKNGDIEMENNLNCPSSAAALTEPDEVQEIVSLIDVKAEEVQISDECDRTSTDEGIVKFSILS